MQQIERYGVIALVFMVVTVVAVYLWGDDGGDGLPGSLRENAQVSSQTRTPAAGERRTPPASTRRTPEREDTTTPLASLRQEDDEAALRASERMLGGSARDRRRGDDRAGRLESQGIDPAPRGGLADLGERGTRGDRNSGPATPVSLDLSPGAGNRPTVGPNPSGNSGPERQTVRTEPVAGSKYRVKEGDSLALIAKRELGKESRWPEIAQLNGIPEPFVVVPNREITLPAGSSAPSGSRSSAPPSSPPSTVKPPAGGRTYTIRKGDSLSAIAYRELGRASEWSKIEALNPGIDPKKLQVGKEIVLPAGAKARGSAARGRIAQADKPRDSRFRVH